MGKLASGKISPESTKKQLATAHAACLKAFPDNTHDNHGSDGNVCQPR